MRAYQDMVFTTAVRLVKTEAQAEDRLRALDSVERARLVRDTREQQARARALREQMRKQEAAEAAAKVSREW